MAVAQEQTCENTQTCPHYGNPNEEQLRFVGDSLGAVRCFTGLCGFCWCFLVLWGPLCLPILLLNSSVGGQEWGLIFHFLILPNNSDEEGTFMQVRVADESQMTAAMASDSEQD